LQELNKRSKKIAEEYTGKKLNSNNIQEEFIRLAYASVASIAIIPIQDILGFGQHQRLNNPSGGKDNWKWKLKTGDQVFEEADRLQRLVKLYWRI